MLSGLVKARKQRAKSFRGGNDSGLPIRTPKSASPGREPTYHSFSLTLSKGDTDGVLRLAVYAPISWARSTMLSETTSKSPGLAFSGEPTGPPPYSFGRKMKPVRRPQLRAASRS